MKNIYKPFVLALFSFFTVPLFYQSSYGQCPDGYGAPTTSIAFDTSFAIPAGSTSMPIYLPKFDAAVGMVNCMRLCLTITGVVDSLSFENIQIAPHTYTANYSRTDFFTGPGLSSPIFNSDSKTYTFALQGDNGIPGSGPDFAKVIKDTVLNAKSSCVTITNVGDLSQFYGQDSLLYNYTITAGVAISSGGNASIGIATSGLVNIRFEYCYCPATVLPLNIYAFDVNKLNETKVDLKWWGYDDTYTDYYYEAEVSRDGNNFSSIGVHNKNMDNSDPYKTVYSANKGETGTYYFRIRQVYSNGYVRYSNIKQVAMENPEMPKFSIYPNPSTGIVGIKFDNSLTGHFNALIYNTQGQLTMEKDIVVKPGSSYLKLTRLVRGVYWLRLTDKKSFESSVNQLLIK